MRHNKLLSLSLLSVLFAASCGGTTPNDPTDDPNSNENPAEVEVFSDKVVQENVDKMLDGFTIEGTITQRRYSYNAATDVDENGHYSIPEDREPIEQNIYHTNVAFNGKTENAFSKYSYREIPGNDGQTITLTSEDYTYFEDEETGYAYEEVIDYKNNVEKVFGSSLSNTSNGLTFGDNGFYNIASLFKEGDLVLDENFVAYTRYDLNIDKAAIISNNLLYSLNSGAYALPTEAYIRADNGVFTSLNIELSPIYSYDSYTDVASLITNSIVFNLGNLGQETITHITPYEETDDSRRLDASLAKFENQNYKMNITIENTELDPNTGGRNETTEARDFYLCSKTMNYGTYTISFDFESSGIKRLLSIYSYLNDASKGKIVFIDEIDANISGVYLQKLVEFLTQYGNGQLCFTAHSLDPMYVLNEFSKSIYFLNDNSEILSWTKNANYKPYILYPEGMIKGITFPIESFDFVKVFDF